MIISQLLNPGVSIWPTVGQSKFFPVIFRIQLKKKHLFPLGGKLRKWSLDSRYGQVLCVKEWRWPAEKGKDMIRRHSWSRVYLVDWYSSVHFSHSVVSNSLRPHESQHARPPCPSPTPRVYSNSCLSRWWCHPAISSSGSPSPPAPNPSQHQGLFQWVNSSHEVAKVLEFQLQHQSFQRTPRTDLL